MVEVDWQGLFNSFFSSVRVKVQCKDPSRIPKQRIFVFNTKLYLLEFKTEGVEQIDSDSDGGSEKGPGEEEPNEEDPKGDDSKTKDKGPNVTLQEVKRIAL